MNMTIKENLMVKYELRKVPGYQWIGDAQEIGERIDMLIEDQGGELTPDEVVRDAITKSSPLHPNFEWDDTVAAHLHRRQTARTLLGAIVVVEVSSQPVNHPVRAFVNIHDRENQKQYYTTVIVAMSDGEKKRQVLEQAWQKLESWRDRYKDLQEFSQIIQQIEELKPTILPMLEKV